MSALTITVNEDSGHDLTLWGHRIAWTSKPDWSSLGSHAWCCGTGPFSLVLENTSRRVHWGNVDPVHLRMELSFNWKRWAYELSLGTRMTRLYRDREDTP